MENERLLKLAEVIGDKKSLPRVAGLIPMSRSHWYAGIQNGTYPKPIKHGSMSFWKHSDIQLLITKLSSR